MNKKLKRYLILANLLALAVILNIIESFIIIPLPIPNAKIGLSNIVTIIVIYLFSCREGFLLAFTRVLLATFLSGRYGQFAMSFTGTMLSTIIMIIVYKLKFFSIIPISIIGSIFHSVGQILGAAIFVVGSSLAFYYLPIMLLVSLPAGLITGIIANKFIKIYQIKNKVITLEDDKVN
ncbi:MAG: Gx transporter family protein [Acholeplasmatales bacterium]|jgi:heptaprenyl diphosphate synthase|nr:Gx transporter family protein [Acholeplasmatales bacterium]